VCKEENYKVGGYEADKFCTRNKLYLLYEQSCFADIPEQRA